MTTDIDERIRNAVGVIARNAPSPHPYAQLRDAQPTGVTVQRGMTHDGLGKYLSQIITKATLASAIKTSFDILQIEVVKKQKRLL